MTISIEEMKGILATAIQENSNSNLQDAINSYDAECNDLHNTIIGNYPLIGLECTVFVPLDSALDSGIYNHKLNKELDQCYIELESVPLEDHYNYFEGQFIDYWIEVATEYKNNTIKAFCSAGNGKHELLSESVDTSSVEAFKAQCEYFVSEL